MSPSLSRHTSRHWLMLLVCLVALPFLACDPDDECKSCDDDEDCEEGMYCASFSDGKDRCADDDTDRCYGY